MNETGMVGICPQPRRSPWRKRLLIAGAGLLVAGIGGYFYLIDIPDRELKKAMAELDRTDPGWRFKDIVDNREGIPDEHNSALIVRGVKELLPEPWPSDEFEEYDGERFLPFNNPEIQFDSKYLLEMTAELENAEEALVLARRLAQFPKGRSVPSEYPLWPSDFSTNARKVAYLLMFDVLLRAQEGDVDGALESCRSMLNVSRCMGDEPGIIALLVRIAIRAMTHAAIERVIAQGQPSETALAALQKLLEDEARQPLLWNALRAERAIVDKEVQAVQAGTKKFADLLDSIQSVTGNKRTDELIARFKVGSLKRNRAALLRFMTKSMDLGQLPLDQHNAELEKLKAAASVDLSLVRELSPAVPMVVTSNLRSLALTHCIIAMLAVERYRLAHQGKWPDSLALLEGKELSKLPADPYDGKPLRYRQLKDGIVIYSVGPTLQNDSGNLDPENWQKAGTYVRCRLWNEAKRRQPWRPRQKDDR